ncbi:folate-binding protein YgfZ [Actinomyces sp. 565]|uniref:CAF17-like 4Fe-4S cluster assembly/insertion protein YgfZ n=1 Tax=Actinomyces sp. 565 TaxID=2057794 RepID=UPI0013A6F2A0|nr:folate-binding protein YgfZ [Actinomyces sp. 565]NDR53267.1 folate-binding protein YgfZ [Actinomyces sp. 565]
MRRSPLLSRTDVVANPATDLDAAVPARYEDPLREQNALLAGRAATALSRDVVAVSGPDRLSWLSTLSSQELSRLTPGDGGAEALLLDAQGHITHALACVDDGKLLLLVTEAGRGRALVEFLESMRFMLRVEVALREDVAVLAALGTGGAALEEAARAAGAHVATWRDPWPGVVEGGTSYDVGVEGTHPGAGYRATWVLVQADAVGAVADAFVSGAAAAATGGANTAGDLDGSGRGPGSAGRRLAGSLAWEALRVEAGRPRWGREVDARTIPHELDWLRTAVHLNKGCYPGQETVARTLNLGRPPRRLTILQLDGFTGQLPVPGAVVRLGERAVGAVTSVVRHVDYGPMALALLRRGVPADAALTVEVTDADDPDANAEEVATAAAGAAGAAGVAAVSGGPGAGELADAPAATHSGVSAGRAEPVVVARVDAAQEPLVSPEGRAQASPAERPGVGLRGASLSPRRVL